MLDAGCGILGEMTPGTSQQATSTHKVQGSQFKVKLNLQPGTWNQFSPVAQLVRALH